MWTLLTHAAFTLALTATVLADYYPIQPNAAAVWSAGDKETITWSDENESPSLARLGKTSIQLWTGGAQSQTLLRDLGTVDAARRRFTVTVDSDLGESGHWYFLRFRGEDEAASDDVFTARFTINGMKGTFSAAVKEQLSELTGATPNNTTTSNDNSASLRSSPTSMGKGSNKPASASSAEGIGASPVSPVSTRPSAATGSTSGSAKFQSNYVLVLLLSFTLVSLSTFNVVTT